MPTLTLKNEGKMNWLVLFACKGSDVWQFIDLAVCVAADRFFVGVCSLIPCWRVSPKLPHPPLYILLQRPAKVIAQYEMPLFQSRQLCCRYKMDVVQRTGKCLARWSGK